MVSFGDEASGDLVRQDFRTSRLWITRASPVKDEDPQGQSSDFAPDTDLLLLGIK